MFTHLDPVLPSLSRYIGCPNVPKILQWPSAQNSSMAQLYQAGVQAEALESAHEDCLQHEVS